MNLFTGQWKITNHKRSPTEQAEKVCPFRDSCQQPPLLSLHLPGPLAVNYKIVYLNITLTYVVQKQNIEKKKTLHIRCMHIQLICIITQRINP